MTRAFRQWHATSFRQWLVPTQALLAVHETLAEGHD